MANTIKQVTIKLIRKKPPLTDIKVIVLNEDDKPVPGAILQLLNPDGPMAMKSESGQDGRKPATKRRP